MTRDRNMSSGLNFSFFCISAQERAGRQRKQAAGAGSGDSTGWQQAGTRRQPLTVRDALTSARRSPPACMHTALFVPDSTSALKKLFAMPSNRGSGAAVWKASVCSATTRRTSAALALSSGRTTQAPSGDVYRTPANAAAVSAPPSPLVLVVVAGPAPAAVVAAQPALLSAATRCLCLTCCCCRALQYVGRCWCWWCRQTGQGAGGLGACLATEGKASILVL